MREARQPAHISPLAAALLLACTPAYGTPAVTRTVGGEARPGRWVSPYAYEQFIRGELAEARGDLAGAARAYRRARTGPQDDPLVASRLADVLDRLDQPREAENALQQAEALDPDSEAVALTRGRIAERRGRMDDAEAAYARAIGVAPRSEDGPLALAALLRNEGRAAEADAVLARFLVRAEGPAAARARLSLALAQSDAEAAVAAVQALLEYSPARASEVRAAARLALDEDHPELAVRMLDALPERPEDRGLRLRAALEAGDTDRAGNVLAGWLPDGPVEAIEVARAHLALGDAGRAVEVLEAAAQADPASSTIARWLGVAVARRDAGRGAEILAAIPAGAEARDDAQRALADTLGEQGLAAVAVELLARDDDARVERAEWLEAAGDREAALRALDGDAPVVLAARAALLERLGRVEEANPLYGELPEDERTVSAAARARGEAERALAAGDAEAGTELLRALVEAHPALVEHRARLAEQLLATDRASEARELASAGLALAAEPAIRQRLARIVTGASTASLPTP